MTTRLREGRWTLDIRHAGTRFRLAVPDDRQTRRGAEAYEKAVLADLAKGIDPRQPKLAPTLTEYSDDYMAAQAQTCRHGTLLAKESLLRIHILPQLGSVRLDQLRSRHVLQLREAMTTGAGTTRNAITLLRHMVRAWYTARDEQGPLLTGQVRRYNPAPKFYSAAEIEKLIAAAREHEPMVLALVLLGADAGLRCGEMTALRWGDLAEGWINVSRSRSPCGRTEGLTKSGRERQVPMTARLVAALEALPRSDEDDHVLLVDGVGANHTHARRRIAKAQVTAGMEVTGLHALRHSYCSTLALSGAPLHVVKALAGHAHLAVTERYLHHQRGDLVDAVKTLGHKMGTPTRPDPALPRHARPKPRIWATGGALAGFSKSGREVGHKLRAPSTDPSTGTFEHDQTPADAPMVTSRAHEKTTLLMARKRAPRTDLATIHRRVEARVDAWLEANEKTRTWLAEETKMGAASMRRALRGPAADKPTSPTLGTLDRFAAVLGIGVDELVEPLEDVEPEPEPEVEPEPAPKRRSKPAPKANVKRQPTLPLSPPYDVKASKHKPKR